MRRLLRTSAAALTLFASGCSSGPKSKPAPNPPPEPKIIQFYGWPGVITEGESAQLCYGVDNARSVRLDPPSGAIRPLYNTCLSVTPRKSTEYRLTAEGADGKVVEAKTEIRVEKGKRRAPLVSFFSDKSSVEKGKPVMLCYDATGATAVDIAPRKTSGTLAVKGCITESPESSLTYKLTAAFPGGRTETGTLAVHVK